MNRQTIIARFLNGAVAVGAVALAAAALLVGAATAESASLTVAWDANTEPDLAGYKVHWGTSGASYSNSADAGMATTWTINNLTPGTTYYIAATARDTAGNESGFSNQVTYTVPGAPEMVLLGNGVTIADGDASPSTTDHTDFGSISLLGGSATRMFAISNAGSADLSLTGSPRVAVTGAQASEFVVTIQPSASLAPGGSTTFQVTFTPAGEGVRAATVSIASNDPDESPYDVSLQGTGFRPAETLSVPSAPSGIQSIEAGGTVTYTLGGAASNWSDPVQYQVEWGDGTATAWLAGGTLTASRTWQTVGTFAVRVKARCATHTPVESAWSSALTVTVTSDRTPPAVPKALRLISSVP